MLASLPRAALALSLTLALACGDDSGTVPMDDAGVPDAGPVDFGPVEPANTDHCGYADLPATARAGGTVEEGAVMAGVAEMDHRFPVGAALGAYTGRARALGFGAPPDGRREALAGGFSPSIGIETRNSAKAIALSAGGETVVLLKSDVGLADAAITHAVEERLEEATGESFAGKVVWATSHSHSGFANYTSNTVLYLGLGLKRDVVADQVVEDLVTVAQAALGGMQPARVGIASNAMFDQEDRVTRDRRGENDELMGGPAKDDFLVVLRVDAMDGTPMAIAPVFGIHGTILGEDNLLNSTEGSGAIERAIEESFDSPVVVMHLQGAAGDVSPAGSGGIACPDKPCYNFAKIETIGRYARDAILTTWMDAGEALEDTLAIEMVTRSVPLGPDWETFTVRDGALEYAPWDRRTLPDRELYAEDGSTVLSPIDEFNAPYGAGLCGGERPYFPGAEIRGTGGTPYGSCLHLDRAAETFGNVLQIDMGQMPACAATRLTLSALKIGEWSFLTAPGEPVTIWARTVRERAPAGADRTVVIGYAQDHLGYLLTVEDWLLQGYEPNINVWGPLEGEYVMEQLLALAPLVETPEREDATMGGTDRWVPGPVDASDLDAIDDAPLAGTLEETPWDQVYVRGQRVLTDSQPEDIRRLESAYFTWIGEDPRTGTPDVRLQRFVDGEYVDIERRSGRPVRDRDLLLTWTGDPLVPEEGEGQTHHWAIEWQAVTWLGLEGLEDLEDRVGVPTGSYRFHVEGTGYSLDSDPFDVVQGEILLEASYADGTLSGRATFHAPEGWRLLHLTEQSNGPIPANGTVVIAVDRAGTLENIEVELATDGTFTVATADGIDAITLTDRFANQGTLSF